MPTLDTQAEGQRLYRCARARIPGGTQLLSKRPEMFLPDQWPSYYSKAQGVEVWDLDGNRYLDMSLNGVGSCALGHADPDVDRAVIAAVHAGTMSTLNCPEEVELADLLCELHPWADMARFTRSGGEALAVAARIARAATGRETIAFCGYHGWHDWYLAANLGGDSLQGHHLSGLDPAGVPAGLTGTMLPFHYNHLDELEAIAADRHNGLAAIVMEPLRGQQPAPGFLAGARRIADRTGAVLIFDEATMGFRLNAGGAHLLYGVDPDMAVFAKAMSNGYAMAAVIGREAVMQAAQSTFISSTYWTERIGPTAALATIKKHKRCNIPAHLHSVGTRVQAIWQKAANEAGVSVVIGGTPPVGTLRFDYPNGQAIRTLYTQLMLDRRILASGTFYATYAHTDSDLSIFKAAAAEVFGQLAEALAEGTVEARLRGPVAHSGFERLA